MAVTRLHRWLDDGVESHGARYVEMRRRLVAYFDRRNRPAAEALAEETFRRIGAELERSAVAGDGPPARHCYVVARTVLHEDLARPLTDRVRSGRHPTVAIR